jgi:hypothetical protein
MYRRGVVASSAASAIFAPVSIGTIGRIVAIAVAIICGSLAIRRILRLGRRA